MKILIWTPKGGTGKTSIATALLQQIGNYQIITNDKMNPYNLILSKEQYYLLPDDRNIPVFKEDVNLIYDFGGFGDQRIPELIQQSKDLIVLIPFTPDIVSFQSAISIFNEIKDLNNNIFFVLNRAKKGDYDAFKSQMDKMKINKALLEIKESKLFANMFNKQQSVNEVKQNKLLSYSYKQVLGQINDLIKELKK
jgi:MinD superfamily P-loop ATPase